ncbi:hypothetical protein D6D18_07953, partial [Aureobasidium pullulans]
TVHAFSHKLVKCVVCHTRSIVVLFLSCLLTGAICRNMQIKDVSGSSRTSPQSLFWAVSSNQVSAATCSVLS